VPDEGERRKPPEVVVGEQPRVSDKNSSSTLDMKLRMM